MGMSELRGIYTISASHKEEVKNEVSYETG